MVIIPSRIKLFGNKSLAEQFIGPAKSQMDILLNQMKFQKINQGVRRVRLHSNIFVECIKIFNTQVINIIAFEIPKEVENPVIGFMSDLFVVFGLSEVKLRLTGVEIPFEIDNSISCAGECSGQISYVDLLSEGSQNIYGDFTGYNPGDLIISGMSSGTLLVGGELYYLHDYKYRQIISQDIDNKIYSNPEKIQSAFDFDNFENKDPEDFTPKEWSKTLKTFMVCAHLWEPKDLTGYDRPYEKYSNIQYNFYASYNGMQVTWGSSEKLGPFFRYRIVQASDPEEDLLYCLHIGFDMWEAGEGDFFVGIMRDSSATLTIYKLNKSTYELEQQTEYVSTVRDDYYTYLDDIYPNTGDIRYTNDEKKDYVRLLGYGYRKETNEHVAYWGDLRQRDLYPEYLSIYMPAKAACHFYCSEVLNTGESERHYFEQKYNYLELEHTYPEYEDTSARNYHYRPELITALWNPITRTIKFVYHDKSLKMIQDVYEGPCDDKPWNDCHSDTIQRYYGDFVVDEKKFSLGSSNSYVEYEDSNLVDAQSSVSNAKRYKFIRGIFTYDNDFIFEYQTNDLVLVSPCSPKNREEGYPPLSGMTVLAYECLTLNEYCYDDENLPCGSKAIELYDDGLPDCECLEYVWQTHTDGNTDYLKYASERFPHDEGWTAILLDATDLEGTPHSGWVIYKDLENENNYRVVTNMGQSYNLPESDRAFFFQYFNQIEE